MSQNIIPITFAIGCAIDGMKQQTLSHYCRHLKNLFYRLRSHYGMVEISQLATRPIWESFMGDRALAPGEINMLLTYDALSSNYQQVYLEGLSERQRLFGRNIASRFSQQDFSKSVDCSNQEILQQRIVERIRVMSFCRCFHCS